MLTFKQYITEMALRMGTKFSNLGKSESVRHSYYDHHKNDPVHSYKIDHPDIKNHIKAGKDDSIITSNDHKKKETVYISNIIHHPANKVVKVPHDEQRTVERHTTDSLPPHHAHNVIMHHIEHSGKPLISSDTQYDAGHKMWRNIVHKSLDKGHHVYYLDGDKTHETTKDNADHHLNSYYGRLSGHEHKHMIVSKHKL